ncbi:hemE [Symbiodinium microadriaticum]|nr:hemE [Symbiodinium microadriaticum]
MTKSLLKALNGEPQSPPPIWLMRQAGRHLPEYRALREQAGDILDICYTPDWAIEATMQPIRRYKMDGAILFADILVIPQALGQKLWFEKGEGPRLTPVTTGNDLGALSLDAIHDQLGPIYKTVAGVRAALKGEGLDHCTHIGFAGGPWTVATYMIAGRGTPDQAPAKEMAWTDPGFMQALIDLIVEATGQYLIRQIDAGAEAVQIFESWAGGVAPDLFEKFIITPTQKIVETVRATHPDIPIIGFPRAAGGSIPAYVDETGVNAVGLDTSVSLDWALKAIPDHICLQGNLDPLLLRMGGDAMRTSALRIRDQLKGRPHIFNLGHGLNSSQRSAMADGNQKIAVVLFNLGGPDRADDIRPFLQNLFSDPAILSVPAFVRKPLAWFIAKRREAEARANYAKMKGYEGGSPLLPETKKQASALEERLGEGFKCFIAMRYWQPRAEEVVQEIENWGADQIILLPLYPQFSTTTTRSSVEDFTKVLSEESRSKMRLVGCYPEADGLLEAWVEMIKQEQTKMGDAPYRLLFSAHGLPQRTVDAGDPYPDQVRKTADAIKARLKNVPDTVVAFQSRVGPLKWTGPYMEDEIDRAARDGVNLLIAPISFVSDHIETLVELDIDYRDRAMDQGVQMYRRVPSLGCHPDFITALANEVKAVLVGDKTTRCPEEDGCGLEI